MKFSEAVVKRRIIWQKLPKRKMAHTVSVAFAVEIQTAKSYAKV